MASERPLLLLILALASLALLPLFVAQDVSGSATAPALSGTTLYLASNGQLTNAPDSPGSADIKGSTGTILVYTVGTWKSAPVQNDMELEGSADISLWASASGVLQLNCYFRIYFGVNDVRGNTAVSTDNHRLSSTPVEFTANSDVSLSLKKGDTVGMWIYSSERGGGGTLLYGSEETPSYVRFPISPVTMNGTAELIGGTLQCQYEVSTPFTGMLDSVALEISGPTGEGNNAPSVANLSLTDGGNGSWETQWDAGSLKEGSYDVRAVAYLTTGMCVSSETVVMEVRGGGSSGGISLAGMVSSRAWLFTTIPFLIIALAAIALIYHDTRGEKQFSRVRTYSPWAALLISFGLISIILVVPNYTGGSPDAPDFTVPTMDNGSFTLSEQKGKVVILDLMGTWCPDCKRSMPELSAVHRDYPNVVMITICISGKDTRAEMESFVDEYHVDWMASYAPDSAVIQDYSITSIPTVVVVNEDSRVIRIFREDITRDSLSDAVESALRGDAQLLSLPGQSSFLTLAFLAGISAFFSPCAFPLLPGYMSYYLARSDPAAPGTVAGGTGRGGRRGSGSARLAKGLLAGGAATLAIILMYSLVGFIVSLGGSFIYPFLGLISPAVALLVVVLGIVMLMGRTIPLDRLIAPLNQKIMELRMKLMERRNTTASVPTSSPLDYLDIFLYGAGYGGASMGCHAAVFIAIVLGAFMTGGFLPALGSFILYGLGMGMIFTIVTVLLAFTRDRLVERFRSSIPVITRISGAVLVLAGIYLIVSYVRLELL